MDHGAFEDANAACSLLPGPSSTQLAIFCAYRVAGWPGAIVGGLGFIVPAVVLVLALSVVFLSSSPPDWIRGAGAGAGRRGRRGRRPRRDRPAAAELRPRSRDRRLAPRWFAYGAAGGIAAATIGPWLVLVLLGCGILELLIRRAGAEGPAALIAPLLALPKSAFAGATGELAPLAVVATGTVGDLAWTALKVGALSFGGGFVIIPLMQGDAVHVYHWMSNSEFLNAVALGQVTPGPVVATVAAVGYGAYGIGGGLLAALIAFLPSFSFILLGGGRFERLRANPLARGFLAGAGPAAIGAIFGSADPARRRPLGDLAVPAPRRRGDRPVGAAARRRRHAARGGGGRSRRCPRGRSAAVITLGSRTRPGKTQAAIASGAVAPSASTLGRASGSV